MFRASLGNLVKTCLKIKKVGENLEAIAQRLEAHIALAEDFSSKYLRGALALTCIPTHTHIHIILRNKIKKF